MNRKMYDATWGQAKFGGNAHQRRKIKRALRRRVDAAGKLVAFQMEHFFDESPLFRRLTKG
jgi:hypothetical protein